MVLKVGLASAVAVGGDLYHSFYGFETGYVPAGQPYPTLWTGLFPGGMHPPMGVAVSRPSLC